MRRTKHKLEPQCDQSCMQGTVQQTRTTLTTKKRHYKQTSSAVIQFTALELERQWLSWTHSDIMIRSRRTYLSALRINAQQLTSCGAPAANLHRTSLAEQSQSLMVSQRWQSEREITGFQPDYRWKQKTYWVWLGGGQLASFSLQTLNAGKKRH